MPNILTLNEKERAVHGALSYTLPEAKLANFNVYDLFYVSDGSETHNQLYIKIDYDYPLGDDHVGVMFKTSDNKTAINYNSYPIKIDSTVENQFILDNKFPISPYYNTNRNKFKFIANNESRTLTSLSENFVEVTRWEDFFIDGENPEAVILIYPNTTYIISNDLDLDGKRILVAANNIKIISNNKARISSSNTFTDEYIVLGDQINFTISGLIFDSPLRDFLRLNNNTAVGGNVTIENCDIEANNIFKYKGINKFEIKNCNIKYHGAYFVAENFSAGTVAFNELISRDNYITPESGSSYCYDFISLKIGRFLIDNEIFNGGPFESRSSYYMDSRFILFSDTSKISYIKNSYVLGGEGTYIKIDNNWSPNIILSDNVGSNDISSSKPFLNINLINDLANSPPNYPNYAPLIYEFSKIEATLKGFELVTTSLTDTRIQLKSLSLENINSIINVTLQADMNLVQYNSLATYTFEIFKNGVGLQNKANFRSLSSPSTSRPSYQTLSISNPITHKKDDIFEIFFNVSSAMAPFFTVNTVQIYIY